MDDPGRRAPAAAKAAVDDIYRRESRRVLASLIRLLGDFELAEEALHDAFIAAVEQWPQDGLPANPRAWLVSTGRFKAVDALRRRARFDNHQQHLIDAVDVAEDPFTEHEDTVKDDYLRLIFTCCHPALTPEARVALTLREVCGLTTEEIARAFLAPTTTLAQRIVRAKNKIRTARIPYEVPERRELGDRLDSVLHVIYLVFNEGYSASEGSQLTRQQLVDEAIRLGHLLYQLMPEPEVRGLLALMLLHDARSSARATSEGDLILLQDQNRQLWNREKIKEGCRLVTDALTENGAGPYCLQAAIAAVHCEAATAAETDWHQIVGLYNVLLRIQPSPIVELNRAVATAMRDGPETGLAAIEAMLQSGHLTDYYLAHAAQADLFRQLGRNIEARAAYHRALTLTQQQAERRFLEKRLAELHV